MDKKSRILKTALGYIIFVVFLYLMTVINLFKSTGRIDWNIFESEALTELIIIYIVSIPIIIVLEYLWNRFKKRRISQDEKVK